MGAMATMARNRALAAQLAVMAVGAAAIAAAAYVLDAADAAVWCAVTGVWCLAVFAVVSFRRYAQIVRLSSEVDEVLHGAGALISRAAQRAMWPHSRASSRRWSRVCAA